uniref:Uncharacterized protein n=1 Tax=Leptocylindrus danicus TaxID=163516 RepID=A0A7S2K040_9STRA|mmetsp:Transcript_15146/g.22343  ORF Transcript_15146/g.22343 Transcript_15146/m.22343 type:complete len:337 (+) Transcript_15146:199-1209(+)
MRNQQSTTTSPYHEKLQNAEERAERSKDAVSSAQKLKHETKLAQMEAEAVVAESATDPFSPQSIRKKVRDVRLALNRARQEKEEAQRKIIRAVQLEVETKMSRLDLQRQLVRAEEHEAEAKTFKLDLRHQLIRAIEQEVEAKMIRSDLQKELDDLIEIMVAVEEAKLKALESAACATAANLERASSELRDAQEKLAAEQAAEAYVSADTDYVGIVTTVMTSPLVFLMLALGLHVLADMPILLVVCIISGVLVSIVIFFTQLGDYMTHKTVSTTNAASAALHNATFAAKKLGRQALSEALGISAMLKGNIFSAASSAVDQKDSVVDTMCAALQGLGK